mgnify:CR=1 FL=1
MSTETPASPLSILVVGAGTMGAGIAQVAAMAGDTVFLYDIAEKAAVAAKERIAQSLSRAEAKGYVDAGASAAALARIHPI